MKKVYYLNTNGTKDDYGTLGTPTKMTYADGSIMHVGDVVKVVESDEPASIEDISIVVRGSGYETPFVMGLASLDIKLGKVLTSWAENLTIELISKYDTIGNFTLPHRSLQVSDVPEKPPIKPQKKPQQLTVQVKADLLFDKPVVKKYKHGNTFIFSGRSVIYINEDVGCYGIATCHPNEIKHYDKEIGMALSYFRAYVPNKED
jgi:hypothetical protein